MKIEKLKFGTSRKCSLRNIVKLIIFLFERENYKKKRKKRGHNIFFLRFLFYANFIRFKNI